MNRETLVLHVPADLGGKRLDQVVSILCPQHSRARLQTWIRAGRVSVDGRNLRQRDILRGGEIITVSAEEYDNSETRWSRDALPLDILYEDGALLIVNKPAGLVVHPGAGNPDHTLLNALIYHYPELERVPRAGIVQRLDKDTSGLMVVARTPESHTSLVEQMRQRSITREYQAVVAGRLTAGGTVEAPVRRHPVNRKQMAVTAGGRTAVTHYRVIKRYPVHTHILCRLETGRTHQIRVHMAHIRHPVIGDPVYGGRPRFPRRVSDELREILARFHRQALHASRLELIHPDTGTTMSWESPLPDDIRHLLAALDAEDGRDG